MKKRSSVTKRKSARRPAAARRAATRKVRVRAARRARSRVGRQRQRAVAKRKTARRPRPVTRKRRLEIPPILFEGDRPAPPPLSGPGQKFDLVDHPAVKAGETGELPEAYGTGRLFVITRDPHWLYAHWDLTHEQQRRYNARSIHGHLVLRTYVGTVAGQPVAEIHVHPESRHWFAHVDRAATVYVAELGYYGRDHKWRRVATSAATVTPPDTVSQETATAFATIPVDMPFEEMLAMVKQAIGENVPLAKAWEEFRQRLQPQTPTAAAGEIPAWSPERERALAEAIRLDVSPCAWMDSWAITELIQGRPGPAVSSPGVAEFGLAGGPVGGEEAIFSPSEGFGGGVKGFWFDVNAELVIYGATEPDATVTFGGRRIALRPDGSFSFRFALPDGQHDLSVAAVSADGMDGRAAGLRFTRATTVAGEVGMHPQDPALEPPGPANVC